MRTTYSLKRIKEIREAFAKFGQVDICMQTLSSDPEDRFVIKITTGFSGNMRDTCAAGTLAANLLPEYPTIDLCRTDKNKFHLTLRP